jgi:hypothetical protein
MASFRLRQVLLYNNNNTVYRNKKGVTRTYVTFEVVRMVSSFMTFGKWRRVIWYVCPKIRGVLYRKTFILT